MKILVIVLAVIVAIGVGLCLNSARYTSKIQKKHPAIGVMVPVNDADVHVLTAGTSGPVVVMIHGASANAREFEWTLAPQLAETHRVLMVDRPGHGYSDRPDDADTLGVQAAQIAGALQALAPGEKATIVGHSFGGAVSLRLALDYPQLVESMVLLAPISHDWGSGGGSWYNDYANHALFGPAFAQLIPLVGPSQIESGVSGVFSPKPVPDDYIDKSAIGLLFRPSEFRANAMDVSKVRLEMAAQQERYPDISVPVVVFSGAQDTVISPQLHVGKLKHQIVGLQLVPLADGGHMPHHAFRDDVVDAIVRLSVSSTQIDAPGIRALEQ